jgi:hypothetical protein
MSRWIGTLGCAWLLWSQSVNMTCLTQTDSTMCTPSSNEQQWGVIQIVNTEDACQQARTLVEHDLEAYNTRNETTARTTSTTGVGQFNKLVTTWQCLPVGVSPRDVRIP